MQSTICKTVSIVIPCRNERAFIGKCLESIVGNDYPKELLDVLVVDGMSEDGTDEIIRSYSERYSFIKALNNEAKTTPVALNTGIKASRGDFIIILGSHSEIAPDFIRNNAASLEKCDADCVGGVLKTLPADDSLRARAIALAISHPFGVGNSWFRIGAEKPRYVDTVPFGCYKKEVFGKIGLFDEHLVRNQDDEFNLRLVSRGGRIMLVPEIISCYYARESLFKLWKMYFQYGYFKPLVAIKVKAVLTWRQLVPALFVGSLIVSSTLAVFLYQFLLIFACLAGSYLVANICFSLGAAWKKSLKFLLILPAAFAVIHVSYGTGYLLGIKNFILLRKHRTESFNDLPLTR